MGDRDSTAGFFVLGTFVVCLPATTVTALFTLTVSAVKSMSVHSGPSNTRGRYNETERQEN